MKSLCDWGDDEDEDDFGMVDVTTMWEYMYP